METKKGEEAMATYRHGHTHLTSQNSKKTVEFYTEVMGAEVVKVRESGGLKLVDINLGGIPIRISSSTGADDAWHTSLDAKGWLVDIS